jgi:hypothetical protein
MFVMAAQRCSSSFQMHSFLERMIACMCRYVRRLGQCSSQRSVLCVRSVMGALRVFVQGSTSQQQLLLWVLVAGTLHATSGCVSVEIVASSSSSPHTGYASEKAVHVLLSQCRRCTGLLVEHINTSYDDLCRSVLGAGHGCRCLGSSQGSLGNTGLNTGTAAGANKGCGCA